MPNSNKTLRILRGGGPEAVDAPQPKPAPQAAAPEQPAAPQMTEKELELSRLLNNARPNRTKVNVLESDISLLKRKIVVQWAKILQTTSTGQSIIRISADLRKAEGKLVVRQQLLATALQNLESARVEAGRQTRYILMGVSPVTPDKATYPRSFENTLLAIVIFAGIYLILSLTVSILREQVTT